MNGVFLRAFLLAYLATGGKASGRPSPLWDPSLLPYISSMADSYEFTQQCLQRYEYSSLIFGNSKINYIAVVCRLRWGKKTPF